MDDVKQIFKKLVHDEESGGFIHSNHCTESLSEKRHQMKDVFNHIKHTSSEERAGKSSKLFSIDSLALKLASNKDYVCYNKTKTETSTISNTSDENAENKQTANTYAVFTETGCSNQSDPLGINKEVDGLSTIIQEIYERSLWRDKHLNDSMKTWTDGGSNIVEETNTAPEISENGNDKPEKLHNAKFVHFTGDGNKEIISNRQITLNENNTIETDGDSYRNYRKIKALEPVHLAHGELSATFSTPNVNTIHEELSVPSPTRHTSNVMRKELAAPFPNQDTSNLIGEELTAPSPTQYISNIIRVPNKPSFIEEKYEHFSRNVEIFLTKDSPTLKSKSYARAKEMSTEDQTSESCLGQNGEIVCANNPEENLTKTGNEKPYVCDICNRSFSQNGHLNRHMRIHTGDKPFQCDVCGKEFSQSGDKRRHERTHTSFRPYQCFICDKEFNQSGHLQRHLRIHAGHILYNNGEFDKELTRQKYTEEKEAAKDKTKKCPLCEKTFIKKYLLDRHVRSHTGETPYKCEECGKGFTRKDRLQTHTRIHTGDKPYVCKYCGKGFNQSSHLKTHIRIHTGDKPYKCGVCGRGFAQSHDRKKHLRVHTGERPYICPLCGKDFNDNSQLWRHTRTHDDFDQSEGTSYKCQICDNEYEYSSQLLQHMKEHADVGQIEVPSLDEFQQDSEMEEVPSLDEFQQDSEMEEVRLTAEALLKNTLDTTGRYDIVNPGHSTSGDAGQSTSGDEDSSNDSESYLETSLAEGSHSVTEGDMYIGECFPSDSN